MPSVTLDDDHGSYGSVTVGTTRNLQQQGMFTVAVLQISTVPWEIQCRKKKFFSFPVSPSLNVSFFSSWRGAKGVCFRFIGGLQRDCQEPNYLNPKP